VIGVRIDKIEGPLANAVLELRHRKRRYQFEGEAAALCHFVNDGFPDREQLALLELGNHGKGVGGLRHGIETGGKKTCQAKQQRDDGVMEGKRDFSDKGKTVLCGCVIHVHNSVWRAVG
jgi:hypothetical protein